MTNIKISALSTVMVFCAVFAGALSVAAPAQQDAGAFTLDGYIRAYIKNSPAVVQDSNALKTAEIAYQNQTINLFLPSSGASAGATPLTKGESPHFDGPYDAGLYVNWNIFNSGRDYLAYIKAKNTLQTARMRFKNAMQDRVLAAINLFYKFQLQEKLLESARRDLADKREQYEFTSLLYRDGQKSYTEMLYSENNLKDSELRMARADADFASSLMSFNNAVSRAADAPAKLDYELEETDAPQDASYDEDLQTAVKNREDINSAILRLHNAQIDRKLTLINNFPSLTADFSFNNNTRDVFGARQNDSGWSMGLSLSVPIGFFWLQHYNDIRVSKMDIVNNYMDFEEMMRDLRSRLSDSRTNLTLQKAGMEIQANNLRIAKERLDIVRAQYNDGNAGMLELTNAQDQYLSSETGNITYKYDYSLSHYSYHRLLGLDIYDADALVFDAGDFTENTIKRIDNEFLKRGKK